MADEPTNPAAPPAWYAGLDEGVRNHVTARGWDKLDAAAAAAQAARSHLEAMKTMTAPPEEMLRLPKDPADPAWSQVWARLGAPAAPDAYKFDDVKFKDGSTLEDDFSAMLRQTAHELHLSPQQASLLAQRITAFSDAAEEKTTADAGSKAALGDQALRQKWAGGYDMNLFLVQQAIQKLGLPIELNDAFKASEGYADKMEALRSVGTRMQEAPFLNGGVPATGATTREAAREQLDRMKTDRTWFERLYVKRDAEALNEFNKLTRIAAGG